MSSLLVIPLRWEHIDQSFLARAAEAAAPSRVVYVSDQSDQTRRFEYFDLFSSRIYQSRIPVEVVVQAIEEYSNSRVVVRNYIEPGNICVIYSRKSTNHTFIAQLGDTHHIHGAIDYISDFLSCCRHDIVFSLSNPLHAWLFSDKAEYAVSLPAYLLESVVYHLPLEIADRPGVAGICIDLTKYQYNRTKVVRRILRSEILECVTFYRYTQDRQSYMKILRDLDFSIIPSLSGQVSPQIYFALSQGAVPVVDSRIIGESMWSINAALAKCCVSIEYFMRHPIDKLPDLKAAYLPNIAQWQENCLQFQKSFGNEFSVLLKMTDNAWLHQYCHLYPALSPEQSHKAREVVDSVLSACKKTESLTVFIDKTLALLDPLYISAIYACLYQVPHLSIRIGSACGGSNVCLMEGIILSFFRG